MARLIYAPNAVAGCVKPPRILWRASQRSLSKLKSVTAMGQSHRDGGSSRAYPSGFGILFDDVGDLCELFERQPDPL